MAGARAQLSCRRTGVARWIGVLAAALALVGFSMLGVAHASGAGHRPGATISVVSGVHFAGAAAGSDKPPQCFDLTSPDCASSDPHVELGFYSPGDTTGCTFEIDIDWGDGMSTSAMVSGGSAGTTYGPYPHDYTGGLGSYQVSWTTTVITNSGNCTNDSGTLEFTLITAGIYRDFNHTDDVRTAVKDGWSLIANVAGLACVMHARKKGQRICTVPACAKQSYDHPTGSDAGVEQVLSEQASPFYPAWISYWTPAVPPVGANLYDAGYAAGQKAAADIEAAATSVAPLTPAAPEYVGLDFEQSPMEVSCGKPVVPGKTAHDAGYKQCWDWAGHKGQVRNCFTLGYAGWKEFATGWAAGLASAASPVALTPAIYVTPGEYADKKLNIPLLATKYDLPVIVAISPVLRKKVPTGPGIAGYAAYGSDADHPAPCDDAPAYIKRMEQLGGISTIQFSDVIDGTFTQSIACKPDGQPG